MSKECAVAEVLLLCAGTCPRRDERLLGLQNPWMATCLEAKRVSNPKAQNVPPGCRGHASCDRAGILGHHRSRGAGSVIMDMEQPSRVTWSVTRMRSSDDMMSAVAVGRFPSTERRVAVGCVINPALGFTPRDAPDGPQKYRVRSAPRQAQDPQHRSTRRRGLLLPG